jgi:hypothetical protein
MPSAPTISTSTLEHSFIEIRADEAVAGEENVANEIAWRTKRREAFRAPTGNKTVSSFQCVAPITRGPTPGACNRLRSQCEMAQGGTEVLGMIKVAIYTFQGGDADKRLRAAGLCMATLDTIRRVHGEPDFNSGQLVDESEIDDSGFYSKSPQ